MLKPGYAKVWLLILFLQLGLQSRQCHAHAKLVDLGLETLYSETKLGAGTLLDEIWSLKSGEAVSPSLLHKVEGFINHGKINFNTVVLSGGRGSGMKPPVDIMSTCKGMIASPSSIMKLQSYIMPTVFLVYAAYNLYQFQKLSNNIQAISAELRKIRQDTQSLDSLLLRIHDQIAVVHEELRGVKISCMEEADVILGHLEKVVGSVNLAKSKLDAIFQGIYNQQLETGRVAEEANTNVVRNVVGTVGSIAGYFILGVAPHIVVPWGALTSFLAWKFHWTEQEAASYLLKLEGLLDHVRELEEKLLNMESDMDILDFQVTLTKTRIQGYSLAEREQILAERESILAEKENIVADRELLLAQRETFVAEREQFLADKEQFLARREHILAGREEFLAKWEQSLTEREQMMERIIGCFILIAVILGCWIMFGREIQALKRLWYPVRIAQLNENGISRVAPSLHPERCAQCGKCK